MKERVKNGQRTMQVPQSLRRGLSDVKEQQILFNRLLIVFASAFGV